MLKTLKNLNGEAVLVNPDQVRWCKEQGDRVTIYFDKDHQLEVPGPLRDVQVRLN